MTPIYNYKDYCSGMRKSIQDKLFFLDKLDNAVNSIFDYGCADGSLLAEIQKKKNYHLTGYDPDETMVNEAKNHSNISCFSDYKSCFNSINPSTTYLNLSSVIHEVYSYAGSEHEIEKFWRRVFNSGFKYISIRDISVSIAAYRPSDQSDVYKVLNKADHKQIAEFVKMNGSLSFNENLLHFLLKYRFKSNWERELRENYLSLLSEDLLKIIPDNYEIIHKEQYVLPFLKGKIAQDFDIELRDNTHIKLLLRRR